MRRFSIPVAGVGVAGGARGRRAGARRGGVGRGGDVVGGVWEVGGGSFPGVELRTRLVRVTARQLPPAARAARLGQHAPPIVARIAADRVVLDPRTIALD